MFVKAFRLFVSSTFQDFDKERRLLQEQVFPALEAHCAKEGFGFRAVDMRWGVNDDAQLNQRTAEICLGEVIEAKGYPAPNLLILIGDRYGWTPLPFAIARDEFVAVREWLVTQSQSEAVAELERAYALDENHLVPSGLAGSDATLIGAYTLRSREDELIELQAAADWAPVEARLRDALQAAARQLHAEGRLRDAELEKYTHSLTEQEIRKGLEQLSEGDHLAAANSIAWVRTTETAEPPVRSLADAVQRALPEGNALHAGLQAGSDGYADHFVEQITAKLAAALDAQIAAYTAREQAPDFKLQTERVTHAAFAAERLRVFVGRESNLSAIAAHIASDVRHPLVLTGVSGAGKTALMAKAAADTREKVVQRFVGASASSTNQRNLLISVIEDLAALGVGSLPAQWEDDDNRFVGQVRDLLSALDQPVAIFIDALDQLRAPYRPMWLPPQLHPKVKLIVSVLDDEAFAAERSIVQGLRRSLPAEAFLAIEPLSENDGADILGGLKRETQRGLSTEQEAYILERFQAAGASPLYLRIAFAIARRWRSSDDPHARGLAGDVTALIGQFLDELSSVHHHEPLLVRRALGLIAAGREGLAEGELIATLSRDRQVMAAVSSERFGAKTDRLPDSVWVRLKRSLATLLVEKGEDGEPLISFFHRQVAEVVRARLYEPEKEALHTALSDHFNPSTDDETGDPRWTRRGLVELPYQLFHAGKREQLDELLTDPAWIDEKVQAFSGAHAIIEDYDRFAKPDDRVQQLIGKTLRLCSGILARDPRQTVAQLHGRLLSAGAPEALLTALVDRLPDGALYETHPALAPAIGPELARFEDHADRVLALAVLADGRLVSGSADKTIRIWDPIAGVELARLEGHEGAVTALAVLPDGRLASGDGGHLGDYTVRLWDLGTGVEPTTLEGHKQEVSALAILPDGRLASASWDETIRIWDLKTGAEVARLEGHDERVSALAILPDGRLASGSWDGIVRLWDPITGVELARLEGHEGAVTALAVLPDGRLASGSDDNTIRLWNLKTGEEISRLEGHANRVSVLTALADGHLASGSWDDTILLWEPDTGAEPARLVGHGSLVTCLAQLPDGRLASGSADDTIRLWNLRSREETIPLESHANRIVALAAMTDGRLASGSWDNTIRIWDAHTRAETARLEDHAHTVAALVDLADGRIASASWDTTIRLWDLVTGDELARLHGNGNAFTALKILPDGRLASGSNRNAVSVWDLSTGDISATLEGHERAVLALAVLADGRLASASSDYTVRLWDPQTGEEIADLVGHQSIVKALAVLPECFLASGSADKTIRIWDTEEMREAAKLEGHGNEVTALAALADGRLASGSDDSSIRLWDPSTAQEMCRLDIDAIVGALVVLADGRLVAGDGLGRLHWLAIKDAGGAERVSSPVADIEDAVPPPRSGRLRPLLIGAVLITGALAAAILNAPALNDVWQAIRAASLQR